MNRTLRRVRYWRNRSRMDAELAEEMEFHRAMLANDGGATAAMGNTTLARETARGVWIWPWLESLWQDVAYAFRTLRRQPGFTLVKQIEPRAQLHAEPLADNFRRKLQPSIYGSQLAGLLGLLALAIASVGMSGFFAYVVGQRTREIGVRMALGARPSEIVRRALGSSSRALAFGLICGIACAAGYRPS